MHDLLRDLAIHESKEDNFFTISSKGGDGNQQALSSVVVRRTALQFCTPAGCGVHSTSTRSLLCFGNYILNYQGFRLLRVLVIEDVDMSEKKVAWKYLLKGLVHLRYLGFRYCYKMRGGFQNISFSTLKNLETLDCWGTGIDDNHSLWTVPSLRHVIMVLNGFVPFLAVGTKDLACHEKIQSLWLSGKWARDACVPNVEMFPKNLTKLKLECSEIEEDPMPILERLQSLRILQLLSKSYMGTKLICSTGGFPSLQKLKLEDLPNLCQWEIKEGAMPILSHLKISDCSVLHTLPELQHVLSLQELIVSSSSDELHNRLQSEDRYKIEHIPSIHISKARYT